MIYHLRFHNLFIMVHKLRCSVINNYILVSLKVVKYITLCIEKNKWVWPGNAKNHRQQTKPLYLVTNKYFLTIHYTTKLWEMFSRQKTLVQPSLIACTLQKSLPKQLRHLVSFTGTWLLYLGVLRSTKKIAYKTLILPKLEYAAPIWSPYSKFLTVTRWTCRRWRNLSRGDRG